VVKDEASVCGVQAASSVKKKKLAIQIYNKLVRGVSGVSIHKITACPNALRVWLYVANSLPNSEDC